MTEKDLNILLLVLCILAALVSAGFQIKGAIECGADGGAYIIPQNSFPVCVQGK